MIKIRLAGGLGNQILQLAAGISLSKFTNKKLLLYSKSLEEYNVKRDFKLSFLGYKTFNNFSFFDKLIFKFRLVYLMNIFFKNFLCDKNFSLYNSGYKNFFLDGYFHDLSNSKLGIDELKKLMDAIPPVKSIEILNFIPSFLDESQVACRLSFTLQSGAKFEAMPRFYLRRKYE